MSNKQRVAAIESFMDVSPGSPTIFLLSLKAGGVGLNLTAASRVFLMDPVRPGILALCRIDRMLLPNSPIKLYG